MRTRIRRTRKSGEEEEDGDKKYVKGKEKEAVQKRQGGVVERIPRSRRGRDVGGVQKRETIRRREEEEDEEEEEDKERVKEKKSQGGEE